MGIVSRKKQKKSKTKKSKIKKSKTKKNQRKRRESRQNRTKIQIKKGGGEMSDYTLHNSLGEGSNASVYLATNNTDKKNYAVKIFKFSSGPDDDKEFKKTQKNTIESEINLLNYLKSNGCLPFVLCIEDSFKDKRIENETKIYTYGIVTEYLENYIELTNYLEKFRINQEDKDAILLKIISNICEGLYKLHNLNIAHRDIKSQNIMINPDTLEIKFIDIGSSCLYRKNPSKIFTVFSSNEYFGVCSTLEGATAHFVDPLSIKKIYNSKYNTYVYENNPDYINNIDNLKKSDLWSLGILLFDIINSFLYENQKQITPYSIFNTESPKSQNVIYDFYKNDFMEYMNHYKKPTANNDDKNSTVNNDDKYLRFKKIMDKSNELYNHAIINNNNPDNKKLFTANLIHLLSYDNNERKIYEPVKNFYTKDNLNLNSQF
jgi:serine/threonine protein kinase